MNNHTINITSLGLAQATRTPTVMTNVSYKRDFDTDAYTLTIDITYGDTKITKANIPWDPYQAWAVTTSVSGNEITLTGVTHTSETPCPLMQEICKDWDKSGALTKQIMAHTPQQLITHDLKTLKQIFTHPGNDCFYADALTTAIAMLSKLSVAFEAQYPRLPDRIVENEGTECETITDMPLGTNCVPYIPVLNAMTEEDYKIIFRLHMRKANMTRNHEVEPSLDYLAKAGITFAEEAIAEAS